MSGGDLIAGLVVAGLGLLFLVLAPALARLQVRLLETQLAWARGPAGPWLWRIIGAIVLVAGMAAAFFASQR